MGADTTANTQGAGSALQVGNLRPLEDDSERRGALGSDAVPPETANEGWSRNGERVSVSTGADKTASTRGGGTPEALNLGLWPDFYELEKA